MEETTQVTSMNTGPTAPKKMLPAVRGIAPGAKAGVHERGSYPQCV